MQHNVIINSIACTVLYVILLFHTIFASQHYFKLNMINQTQVFVEGGQVSDKSNTRDHNTVYSKQIFIICYTAHRTCPRCLFRSVHIYAVSSPRLEACCDVSRVPDRSQITRSALQIRTPYKHTTGSAQQSYKYFCTATQFTILKISNSTLLYDVCKKIHYLHVRCSGILRVRTTQLPFLLLTPPLLFLSGQGVRNL